MRLFLARNAFPLAVGTVAALFLGLFFLLPVLKVFGASILDASGKSFTLANYVNILSNRFFLNGLTNSLDASRPRLPCRTVLVGVPFAFCLARLPIGGKPVLLALAALAAGAAVVRRRLCAGAAVRPLRPRDRHAAIDRHSVRVDLRREGHHRRLYADALSLRRAAGHRRVQVDRYVSVEEAAQNLGSSRARMLRTVTLPLVLPSILAGALLVFIEALENFGVPFVLAEDKTDPVGRGL